MPEAAVSQKVGGLHGDNFVGQHGGVTDRENQIVAAIFRFGFCQQDEAIAVATQANYLSQSEIAVAGDAT